MSNARHRWDRFKRSEFVHDLKILGSFSLMGGALLAADFYAQTH